MPSGLPTDEVVFCGVVRYFGYMQLDVCYCSAFYDFIVEVLLFSMAMPFAYLYAFCVLDA